MAVVFLGGCGAFCFDGYLNREWFGRVGYKTLPLKKGGHTYGLSCLGGGGGGMRNLLLPLIILWH